MSRFLAFTSFIVFSVSMAYAQSGDTTNISIGFIIFAAALHVMPWLLLTILVYVLLRRLAWRKRIALTLLFMFFPVLKFAAEFSYENARGRAGYQKTTPSSTEPVTIAGAIFPAGSEIYYEQDGNWGKRPVRAFSEQPVDFGTLKIVGLRIEYDGEYLSYKLAYPQRVDGWLCDTYNLVSVYRNNTKLKWCTLEGGEDVGGIRWPKFTQVRKDEHQNWQVSWRNSAGAGVNDYTDSVTAFRIEFNQISAKYDSALKILDWQGVTSRRETKVGRFTFAPLADVQLTPEGGIRITGNGRDDAGVTINCVLVDADAQHPRPCSQ